MNISNGFADLVGSTPLVKLNRYMTRMEAKASIFAKLEYYNPAGSIKDRIACRMLADGMESGRITKETVIIEPTSGNTGIGLAAACASFGLCAIIVMPESMSIERRKIISLYGARLVLTPAKEGMKGAIAKANELAAGLPDAFIPMQFENPSNPKAHYTTTGPELFSALDGKIDILVAGVGTGGTICGTSKYLKEKCKNVCIVAVEPADSPVLSGGKSGSHRIQGIGAGFVPAVYDASLVDDIIKVSNDDAYLHSLITAKCEGLLVGISSGAALCAAAVLAARPENTGKNIVSILPDTGLRYLSDPLFE